MFYYENIGRENLLTSLVQAEGETTRLRDLGGVIK